MLLKFFLSLFVRLFRQCHVSRVDEVLNFGDSMEDLHKIFLTPMNCPYKSLVAFETAQGIFINSFRLCDSPSSLKTLWSVVIESPNFSAQGRVGRSPCHFCSFFRIRSFWRKRANVCKTVLARGIVWKMSWSGHIDFLLLPSRISSKKFLTVQKNWNFSCKKGPKMSKRKKHKMQRRLWTKLKHVTILGNSCKTVRIGSRTRGFNGCVWRVVLNCFWSLFWCRVPIRMRVARMSAFGYWSC